MGEKLKILHIYKSYIPEVMGGVARVIANICDKLGDKFEFTVLCSREQGLGKKYKEGKAKVIVTMSLVILLSMPIAPFYIIWSWILSRRSNIVHAHYPMPLTDIAIALYFPKKTRLIYQWHSEIFKQKSIAFIFDFFTRMALKKAHAIVVTDKIMYDNSKLLAPFWDKIKIINFGIETDKWQLTPSEIKEVEKIKKKYGKFAVAVGRLVEYKGFDVLVEAAKIAAYKGYKFNYVIIGSGKLYDELTAKINTYNLQDHITIITKADDKTLKIFYHASEFFLFPSVSINEAFGIVQLEAMACGKPVINTNLPTTVPKVARHEKEGLTVEVGDAEGLADAIVKLTTQDEVLAKFSTAAKKRVVEVYSLNKVSKDMEDLYNKLI